MHIFKVKFRTHLLISEVVPQYPDIVHTHTHTHYTRILTAWGQHAVKRPATTNVLINLISTLKPMNRHVQKQCVLGPYSLIPC